MTPSHAVVIGGSIAGMTAAQALRSKFDTVTILEMDGFPDRPQGRRGTPQAWHSHLLLDRGRDALDSLFPGFTQYCVAQGGVIIDPGYDSAQCFPDGWYPRKRTSARTLFASRPKIENTVREMTRRDSGITFVENVRVTGLTTSSVNGATRVTGVTYEPARDNDGAVDLAAGLVVDAGGRGSRCAKWMQDFGISVDEQTLDAGVTYSSRWYRMPEEPVSWWKWLVLFPAIDPNSPPEHQYVCTIFPTEDNGVIATMGSWGQPGAPAMPATNDEFVAVYRRTRHPEFSRALDLAEPISDVHRTKATRNMWRRFDKIANPPAGYIAVGDAVCAFNPIYGQGMTCGASNAIILRDLLSTHDPADTEFARTFYGRQAELLDRPWQLAVNRDGAYPHATGTAVMKDGMKKKVISKFTWSGFQFINEAAYSDRVVKEHYDKVNNLYESLTDLLGNARVVFGLTRFGVSKVLGRRVLQAQLPAEPVPARD